jgi:hypothetical protein
MDLTQIKLSRAEWDSIEIPVSEDEKKILDLLINGYNNPNITSNETMSIFTFTKVEQTPENEMHLYKKYFEEKIKEFIKKYGKDVPAITQFNVVQSNAIKKIKSIDSMRLNNLDSNIKTNQEKIYEYLLLDLCKDMLKYIGKQRTKYTFYLYTLIQLKKATIKSVNTYVIQFIDILIEYGNSIVDLTEIIDNAYNFIEKNKYLLKYGDKTLFDHQKRLFSLCKRKHVAKLILYIAPTGTGKTISPIGLANEHKVIFVCAARHIGLALAKSAISMEKKVAFAFGCETASDIRLHYFSAVNYTKNKKSGGIGKVDNSIGTKVEIMICDVASYLTAMYYMLSFNDKRDIITYWDEPTISMDYETHPLHDIIHRNWEENKIPNVVLSCATLPMEEDIYPTLMDFRARFDNAEIEMITNYDCRKSIPLINKEGYSSLPHTIFEKYEDMIQSINYSNENKTLLRYFDLSEIIRFLYYVNKLENCLPDLYKINSYFSNISEITMESLKNYYLIVCLNLNRDLWENIYNYIKTTQKSKFDIGSNLKRTTSINNTKSDTSITRTYSVCAGGSSSSSTQNPRAASSATSRPETSTGVLATTYDAYTLTDGPTIFLCNEVEKIGTFYVQQLNIPLQILNNILQNITQNNELSERIMALEQKLEDKMPKKANEDDDKKGSGGSSKKSKEINMEKQTPEIKKLMREIDELQKQIKYISLDSQYVPNTCMHQKIWAPSDEIHEDAFVPSISEDVIRDIMATDISTPLKMLSLIGIGIFMENPNPKYIEIIKNLAINQKLYMIIASSDYIYGTNYQFCHGFIGKDLTNMTQQKTIQACGRIGRNNIQQTYTIRFRDNEMLHSLFKKPDVNLEAINMCRLFCS